MIIFMALLFPCPGGHFAHVHDEAIDPNHDDAAGEARLHGRFSDMLSPRPPESR